MSAASSCRPVALSVSTHSTNLRLKAGRSRRGRGRQGQEVAMNGTAGESRYVAGGIAPPSCRGRCSFPRNAPNRFAAPEVVPMWVDLVLGAPPPHRLRHPVQQADVGVLAGQHLRLVAPAVRGVAPRVLRQGEGGGHEGVEGGEEVTWLADRQAANRKPVMEQKAAPWPSNPALPIHPRPPCPPGCTCVHGPSACSRGRGCQSGARWPGSPAWAAGWRCRGPRSA
jgi:hypothetical protein